MSGSIKLLLSDSDLLNRYSRAESGAFKRLSPAAPLLIYRLSVDESRGLQDLGMLGRCKIDDAIYFPFSKHRDRGYLPPVSWSKEDKVSLRTFLTTQGLWLKSDDDAEI